MAIYLLAFGAALCLAAGSVAQQRAAAKAPPEDMLRFSLLWWLAHQPVWLAGVALFLVGNLLSASALARASIALVEPLLTVRLLFAFPMEAAWARRSLTARDWIGALATAAGLAIFVVAGDPHQRTGRMPRPGSGWPRGSSWPRWR